MLSPIDIWHANNIDVCLFKQTFIIQICAMYVTDLYVFKNVGQIQKEEKNKRKIHEYYLSLFILIRI